MKKTMISILIVLAVIFAAAAVQASYPVKVTDDMKAVTTIGQKPMRIVSLAPSNTEILFALGLGNRVVGRTDFCDYPAEAAKVPSVGGYTQPSVESIMAVKPDLVIASFGNPKEMVERLRKLGIPVLAYNPQTVNDVLHVIWEIGKVTGAEDQATELISKMRDQIAAIEKLVKNASRPKVFWEVWHDPLSTAGANTFINDMIKIAGGINISEDAGKGWPAYSLETLLIKNPDVYIATKDKWSSPGNIPERPGYNQLKAVKLGQVYVINADNVNRPGPRLIEGLKDVVRVIHPELFKK